MVAARTRAVASPLGSLLGLGLVCIFAWLPALAARAEDPEAAPAKQATEAGKKAAEKGAEAVRAAREAAHEAKHEAKRVLKEQREHLRQTFEEAREKAKQSAKAAKVEAKQAIEAARDEAKEKIKEAHAHAHEAIDDAKQKAMQAMAPGQAGHDEEHPDVDERKHQARKRAWRKYVSKVHRPREMPPALRMELHKHARRMARLARIETLAAEIKDDELLARARKLRAHEQARHDKKHAALLDKLSGAAPAEDDDERGDEQEPGLAEQPEGQEDEDEQGGQP